MRRLVLSLMGATALTMASAASATLVITTPTSVSVSGPNTVNNIDFVFGYSNSDTTSPFSETVSWMNDLAGLYSLSLTTSAVTADGPTDVDISAAFVTGTYTLTVEGTRGEIGSYGGNVSFQAHPEDVPEPATWG